LKPCACSSSADQAIVASKDAAREAGHLLDQAPLPNAASRGTVSRDGAADLHRVYRLDRQGARELFGERIGDAVPEEGLTDVHRYLNAVVEGRRIVIDATFPGEPWDEVSSLPLACGPGRDHPAGADPDAEKRALGAEHCDAAVREVFIAALSDPALGG
jgi:hypothetical protein